MKRDYKVLRHSYGTGSLSSHCLLHYYWLILILASAVIVKDVDVQSWTAFKAI